MTRADRPRALAPHLDVRAARDGWRTAHPHTTLTEIEAALDEQLLLLRQRLLHRAGAQRTQADWRTRWDCEHNAAQRQAATR